MRFLFTYTFLFIQLIAWGQSEVKATLKVNSSEIQTNQLFEIIVETNTQGSIDIKFPNEFQIVNRTQQSYSTSGTSSVYINGRQVYSTQNETTFQYKYITRIAKNGTYTLKDGVFNHKNGKIPLNSLTINVTNPPPVSNSVKSNLSKNFFGIISSSRSEVYVGEPVVVSSKVYSKARITDVANYEPLSINGLAYKTDLFKNLDNLQVEREQIERINFQTIKLSENLIIPQEAGEITCSPFVINIGYQGNFFFSDYARIESGSTKIKVLPLPDNAPDGFNGAVGKYTISYTCDHKELKEGDIFIIKTKIEGKGNLHLISTPELILPDGFEQYGDPVKKEKVTIGANGGEGVINIEYTIQALAGGEYEWTPFEFAHFNPFEKSYKKAQLPELNLTIAKSEFSVQTEASNIKRDIDIKSDGLRYISTEQNPVSDNFIISNYWYWILLILLPLLGLGLGKFTASRIKNSDQITTSKFSKKASKLALKEMAKANELWNSNDFKAFAIESHAVLYQFIARKLKCKPSELSKEKITLLFSHNTSDDSIKNELLALIDKLEFIKYGSSAFTKNENIPSEIQTLIQKIDASWS
jgi:hypothetical protein